MPESPNKAAALQLANLGFRIFPCRADKTPMVSAWEDAATNSPFAVGIRWDAEPDALPAIPVGTHGLVVIDCDRKRGVDGVAAFHALCADHRIDLSNAFVVETPNSGIHVYWRSDVMFGNSRGSLPDGIDVRGVGGYVIAPGAMLPDGRSYGHVAGSWDALPTLPEALASFLKPKLSTGNSEPSANPVACDVTDRERAYAENALADEIAALSSMRHGEGRNAALNRAAHSVGTMVGAGWIERETAEQALWEASEQNSYRAKDGDAATWKTLQSGLESGITKPRDPLPASDVPQWIRETVANLLAAHKAKQSAAVTSTHKRSVALIQGCEIQERPVSWLWDQYLPMGKLTLLAGAGGTGKSTIAFNLAGVVANGGIWPDGTRCRDAGNVLIWSSEDSPEDTIKPRLMAIGANERRYGVIAGTIDENGVAFPFDAARDMDALRDARRANRRSVTAHH